MGDDQRNYRIGQLILVLFAVMLLVLSTLHTVGAEPRKFDIVPQLTHGDSIMALTFSRDGNLVLSGAGNVLKLWEVRTGRLVRTFIGHAKRVRSVAFAPNQKQALSASDDGTLKLWNVETGALLRTFEVSEESGAAIAFSKDGSRIISGSGAALRLWDVNSDKPLHAAYDNTTSVHAVAFSADGMRYLSMDDKSVKVWDAGQGTLIGTFAIPYRYEFVQAVAFSADGTRAVRTDRDYQNPSDSDSILKLWSAAPSAQVRTIAAPPEIHIVAFSPDGKRFLSVCRDGKATLWDYDTGRPLRIFNAGRDIAAVAFSPDGTRIVTGNDNHELKLWDIEKGQRIETTFGGSAFAVNSVAYAPDGQQFLAASGDGLIRLWDKARGVLLKTFDLGDNNDTLLSINFNPNGKWFFGEGYNAIYLWRTRSDKPKPIGKIPLNHGYSQARNRVPYVAADHFLLVGGKSLTLWDMAKFTRIRSFDTPATNITSVAISPDGKYVLSGGEGSSYNCDHCIPSLQLWDMSTGKLLNDFSRYSKWVCSVAFSPDGRRIATSTLSEDGLTVWDSLTGKPLYQDPALHCGSLAFSPNGERLLWGSSHSFEAPGALIDTSDDRAIHQIVRFPKQELSHRARGVWYYLGQFPSSFSADGRQLLVAYDNGLEIRDSQTGALVSTMQGHDDVISAARFSPDGKRVVSSSVDGTTRIWNTATGEELIQLIASPSPYGQWLAITPAGFFNSSSIASDFAAVVQGIKAYAIAQFHESLYRPDLVTARLGGDPLSTYAKEASVLDLGKILDSGDPPELTLLESRTKTVSGGISVTVRIKNGGGKIGKRLIWSVDGHTQGITFPPALKEGGMDAVFVEQILKGDVEKNNHTIEVVAHNAANTFASEPYRFEVGPFGVAKRPPRMYVLAIGIDNYHVAPLKYASSDARNFAQAMQKVAVGPELFAEVKPPLVVNNDENRVVTVKTIEEAFDRVANDPDLRFNDLFVLFMAGHGSYEGARYHFIPQDYDFSKGDTKENKSIDKDMLLDLISRVQVEKRVIILDTCASGSFGGGPESPDQVAAKELNRATRDVVLAASKEAAYEQHKLGYGLLTYGFLDRFVRHRAADEKINVTFDEAAINAISKVKQLSGKRQAAVRWIEGEDPVYLGFQRLPPLVPSFR